MAEFSTRMGLVYEITVDGKEKLVGALKQAETAAKQTATSAGQIGTKLDAATGSANKFGSSLMSAAKQAVAVYAGVQGLRFIANSVLEQEKAVSALNASLKNTEVYSDQFSKSLQDNATALQKLTIYEDDAITMGTALMQSVGKLSQEELPRAQKAALGLAAAFGMDIQTAFQLMGKAAAGNTATLARYGIVLEEGLSASEKFQKILDIGVGKFGIAEAAAKTAAGQWEQLKNVIGDVAEVVGAALIPIVMAAVAILKPLLTIISALSPTMVTVTVVTIGLVAAIAKLNAVGKAALAIQGLTGSMSALKAGLGVVATSIGTFLKSIGPVGWAITGVGAAAFALAAIFKKTSSSADGMSKSMAKVIANAQINGARFDDLARKYTALRSKATLTAKELEDLRGVISQMKNDYPEYLANLDLEKGKHDEITKAINATSAALRQKAAETVSSDIMSQYSGQLRTLLADEARLEEAFRKLQSKQPKRDPYYNPEPSDALSYALPGGIDAVGASMAEINAAEQAYYNAVRKREALLDKIQKDTEEARRILLGLTSATAVPQIADTGGGKATGGTPKVIAETESEYDKLVKTVDALRESLRGLAAETETEADKLRKMTSEYLGLVTQLKKLNANTEADSLISEMGRTFERYADSILSDSEDILWKWKNIRSEAAGLDEEYRGQSEAIKSQVEELQALLDMRNINASPEMRTAFGLGEKADIENAIKNLNDARALLQSEWHRQIIITQNNELLDQLSAQLGLIEDVTISYEKYHEMRSSQIKAEMDLLRARGDIEAGFIDMAEASQMGKIQAEWNERQSNIESDRMNQMIEDNQLLYNSIEGLVDATTNGFARMITEGKSLSETMKNIFQDWVSFAVNELEKLIAKFLIMSIFNALVPGAGVAVEGLPGLLSGNPGGGTGGGIIPEIVGMASYSGGNTVPTLPAPSANADLLSEIRGLRRDVYAAQPTAVQMNFRKGELSYAVDRDRQNRRIV